MTDTPVEAIERMTKELDLSADVASGIVTRAQDLADWAGDISVDEAVELFWSAVFPVAPVAPARLVGLDDGTVIDLNEEQEE